MEKFEQEGENSIDDLKRQLETAGINIAEWGTGNAKTLEHLWREIESGETIIIPGEAGELLRRVAVGSANIYYKAPDGKKYRLREERQVFKDGRERQRELDQSLAEKIKAGEDPEDAIIRGIQEELRISGKIVLTAVGTKEKLITSPSYPGLQSKYILHRYEALLEDSQYKPEGYVEDQEDINTFFVWEEVV